MGLCISHGDTWPHADWSYGGFHEFRVRLAAADGIPLTQMRGFGGDRPWDEFDSPLKPLLNHSDCEGELTPAECAQVAPRLAEIIAGWDEGDYDRVQGEFLVRDMRAAAAAGDCLEFA